MCTRRTLFFKGKCHSRREHDYDTEDCEEKLGENCPYLIEGPIIETGLDCVLCNPRPRRKLKKTKMQTQTQTRKKVVNGLVVKDVTGTETEKMGV